MFLPAHPFSFLGEPLPLLKRFLVRSALLSPPLKLRLACFALLLGGLVHLASNQAVHVQSKPADPVKSLQPVFELRRYTGILNTQADVHVAVGLVRPSQEISEGGQRIQSLLDLLTILRVGGILVERCEGFAVGVTQFFANGIFELIVRI